jgi:hypothetical protein
MRVNGQTRLSRDAFKQRQLGALKREIAIGIEDLAEGRYRTYTDKNVKRLVEEIGRAGRARLKATPRSQRPPDSTLA